MFPIQPAVPLKDYPPQLHQIPWGLIASHEAQALHNHYGQSLERLAERCGLFATEAVAVIENKEYRERWPLPHSSDQLKEGIVALRKHVDDFYKAISETIFKPLAKP